MGVLPKKNEGIRLLSHPTGRQILPSETNQIKLGREGESITTSGLTMKFN